MVSYRQKTKRWWFIWKGLINLRVILTFTNVRENSFKLWKPKFLNFLFTFVFVTKQTLDSLFISDPPFSTLQTFSSFLRESVTGSPIPVPFDRNFLLFRLTKPIFDDPISHAMSFSDSGSSSNGGDYKTFRQITRESELFSYQLSVFKSCFVLIN